MRLLHAWADPLCRLCRSGGARWCAQPRHTRRSTDGQQRDSDRRGNPRADEREFMPLRRLSEHRGRRETGALIRRIAEREGGCQRGALMNAVTFERLARQTDAASAVAGHPGAMFLAGGTTLVDLMRVDVLTPDTVVDVRHLGLSTIDVSNHAIAIGAA